MVFLPWLLPRHTLFCLLRRIRRSDSAPLCSRQNPGRERACEAAIKTQVDIIMRAALEILHSDCHLRTDNDALSTCYCKSET
jgi:hypothetical protein